MSTLTGVPDQQIADARRQTDPIAWALMARHRFTYRDCFDTRLDPFTRLWAPVYQRVIGTDKIRRSRNRKTQHGALSTKTLTAAIIANSVSTNKLLVPSHVDAITSAPLGLEQLQTIATAALIYRISQMAPVYKHHCTECIPLGRMTRQSSSVTGQLELLHPEDADRDVDLYYCREHVGEGSEPMVVIRLGDDPARDQFTSRSRLPEPHIKRAWELAQQFNLACLPRRTN